MVTRSAALTLTLRFHERSSLENSVQKMCKMVLNYVRNLYLSCFAICLPLLFCLFFSYRRRCLRERWTVRFKEHIGPLQKDNKKHFQGYLIIYHIFLFIFFGRYKVVHIFGLCARETISKTENDNWNFVTKFYLLITVILASHCYYSLEYFCINYEFLLYFFQSSIPKLLSDSLPSSLQFPIARSNSSGSGG